MTHFDQFRRMGQHALEFSQLWMQQPSHVSRAFAAYIYESLLGSSIHDAPEEVVQSILTHAIIVGRWAMCGFPTVTMGHKTAAAFCATKMRPEDAAEFVRPPWPAFCIRLPNDLLHIDDQGVQREAQLLMVTALEPGTYQREGNVVELLDQPKDQHRWWYKLCATSPVSSPEWAHRNGYNAFFEGISLWGFNQATAFLATPDGGESEDGYRRWDSLPAEDCDKRSDRLCRSLILSTCMYLSGDPRERQQRAQEGGVTVKERKSKKREGDEFPQYTNFEISSSIKINLSDAIREYVRKGGSAPTVQTYVQGHWKRVPFGPGGAQRKLTHVQAYWRGDLNAPISIRTK